MKKYNFLIYLPPFFTGRSVRTPPDDFQSCDFKLRSFHPCDFDFELKSLRI